MKHKHKWILYDWNTIGKYICFVCNCGAYKDVKPFKVKT